MITKDSVDDNCRNSGSKNNVVKSTAAAATEEEEVITAKRRFSTLVVCKKTAATSSSLLFIVVILSSLLISTGHCSPINRQAGISENVYITVQNDTYGNEQRVCSIESMTYEDGESIPTSSPCEHCICRPPGFACTIISCDYRPGCKALKRSNQCCPEYQCECEKDGKIYQNGEKILDDNNPCEVCYCQGGDVVCAVIDCYWRSDCQPRYIENRCCPLYDHCPPPSDIGPILPTTRPTTTTTTLGPISWFNLSVAIEETSTPKPLRPFTSTEVVPVSQTSNVLIEAPVEISQPVENAVDVVPAVSASQENPDVQQGSQEIPQVIIQPQVDEGQNQVFIPVGEPLPSSTTEQVQIAGATFVEVSSQSPPLHAVGEFTKEPLVLEVDQATQDAQDKVIQQVHAVVAAVPDSEPPSINQEQVVPPSEPVQAASQVAPSEEPVVVTQDSTAELSPPVPAVQPEVFPSAVENEVQLESVTVPSESESTQIVVLEPSQVSSELTSSSLVPSEVLEPSSASQVVPPVTVEPSEVSFSGVHPSNLPSHAIIIEAQIQQESESFTLTSQQIITITPTRSFMTELSTETVLTSTEPVISESNVVVVESSSILPSTTIVSVQPSVLVAGPVPIVEHIEGSYVEESTTQKVPPQVDVQVSIEVVSAPTEQPVQVQESTELVVQPTEVVVEEETRDPIQQLRPISPSIESDFVPSTDSPFVVSEEPVEVTTGKVESPADLSDDTNTENEVQTEEKSVVIVSQPVVPATSPPETVVEVTFSPDDLDVSDDASDSKIVQDDEKVAATVQPDVEEKIVIIESQPIVPATSPPETDIATIPPEPEQGLGVDDVSDDHSVDVENDVSSTPSPSQEPEVVSHASSSTAQSVVSFKEEPTTLSSLILGQDAADDSQVGSDVEDIEPVPELIVEPLKPETLPARFPDEEPPVVATTEIEQVASVTPNVPKPSVDLIPPIHDFKPRPEEEYGIQYEEVVPTDAASHPQELSILSQVKPLSEESGTPSVIFEPPLSILYLPAKEDPVTTISPPLLISESKEKPVFDEVVSEPEDLNKVVEATTTTTLDLNELVFDPVPPEPVDEERVQDSTSSPIGHDDSVPAVAHELNVVPDVIHDEAAHQHDDVSEATTAESITSENNVDSVSHDEPNLDQFPDDVAVEATTEAVDPVASDKENAVQVVEVEKESVSTTTVTPPVQNHVSQVVEAVSSDEPVFEDPLVGDLQDDLVQTTTAEAALSDAALLLEENLQHDLPTTNSPVVSSVESVHDHNSHSQPESENLIQHDGVVHDDVELTEVVPEEPTTLPPESKYRLDLDIFEDEKVAPTEAAEESSTSVVAKHDLIVQHDDSPTTVLPPVDPEVLADNLLVFDEIGQQQHQLLLDESEKAKPTTEASTDKARIDLADATTVVNGGVTDDAFDDVGSGSGDGSTPSYRHHHPDHREGETGSGVGVTEQFNEVTTSGSVQIEEDTTALPLVKSEPVVITPQKPRVPIPPELVKNVAPISPDLAEENFSRSDHSIQSEAEAEVARADESWFWRTFNKIMTLPDYLRSSRRPRSTTEEDTSKLLNKKFPIKNSKKAVESTETKKRKEWSRFPRFLLW